MPVSLLGKRAESLWESLVESAEKAVKIGKDDASVLSELNLANNPIEMNAELLRDLKRAEQKVRQGARLCCYLRE